ncbi:MAG: hypothetical protein H0T15_09535 [Thermoleophilaceae bacterium]|nr:hypothetical protein [Thermoleophilaceae bacterium]
MIATQNDRRRYRDAAESLRENLGRRAQETAADAVSRSQFDQRISQLESLADFARPVSIGEPADVPAAPASPRPLRNGILGLLLGLTLGIIAAFVRDVLDRRLKFSGDIEDKLGLPVLGHIGKDALGRVVMPSNGHKDLSAIDLEAFRMLRMSLEFMDVDNPLRSVLVTSGLPEEGKSTVAASLAAVTAMSGKRVLLVECDLHRPSLAGRLSLAPTPGLSDYLAGKASPQEVLQTVNAPGEPAPPAPGNGIGGAEENGGKEHEGQPEPATSGLVCITAGSRVPRPADMLDSERFRSFLDGVAKVYDLVVLDSSPLLSVSDSRGLVSQVDAVLLCVRAWQTTDEEASAAKATLERFPARNPGVVITGVRPSDAVSYGYYSYGDYSYPAS